MAYNTKSIIKDKDGNPISQYYNPNTDQYEPVKGAGGGSAVILYNEDGTENNSLSLIPILDKLSELTGTVIDEETRKSNELQRIEFYNQLQKMLADGELKGDKGDTGLGLQFDWKETSLGVKVEGNTEYIYVDLRGPQGPKGETGDIDNLDSSHIESALGYLPTSIDDISTQITAHNESEDAHPDIRNNIKELSTQVDNTNREFQHELETKFNKSGGYITGLVINGQHVSGAIRQSYITGVSRFIIDTKIKRDISHSTTMLHIRSAPATNSYAHVLDIIIKFDSYNLGNSIRAYSYNSHTPELKIGYDSNDNILIYIKSDSPSYGFIHGDIYVSRPNSITDEMTFIFNKDLPETVKEIYPIPYSSKGEIVT